MSCLARYGSPRCGRIRSAWVPVAVRSGDGRLRCQPARHLRSMDGEAKGELIATVKSFETRRSPLATKIGKPKAKWVEPRVLVDVEYRAKTKASGLLRHPRLGG